MKITRDNYEAFLVDYLEGNLSVETVAELTLFLEQHPDLKATLDGFEGLQLEQPQSLRLEDKGALHRHVVSQGPINAHNYEQYFARAAEQDLDAAEEQALQEFLATNPALEPEYRLYQHTRLQAPSDAVLGDRKGLVRTVVVVGPVTGENYEDYLIGAEEGTLDAAAQEALQAFRAANPWVEREAGLYGRVRLEADAALTFADRASLKQPVVVALHRKRPAAWWAAAASVAILFTIGWWWQGRSGEEARYAARGQATRIALADIAPAGSFQKTATEVPAETSETVAEAEMAVAAPQQQQPDTQLNALPGLPREAVAIQTTMQPPVFPEANPDTAAIAVVLPEPTVPTVADVHDPAEHRDSAIVRAVAEQLPAVSDSGAVAAANVPDSRKRGLTIGEFAVKQFKEAIGEPEEPTRLRKEDAVTASVKGVNRLLPGDIHLTREKNNEGEVVAWALTTPLFSVRKKSRRK
ncbi:MAG: hypothetical protein AAGB22_03845 [Bacteroidota bacterium]